MTMSATTLTKIFSENSIVYYKHHFDSKQALPSFQMSNLSSVTVGSTLSVDVKMSASGKRARYGRGFCLWNIPCNKKNVHTKWHGIEQ